MHTQYENTFSILLCPLDLGNTLIGKEAVSELNFVYYIEYISNRDTLNLNARVLPMNLSIFNFVALILLKEFLFCFLEGGRLLCNFFSFIAFFFLSFLFNLFLVENWTDCGITPFIIIMSGRAKNSPLKPFLGGKLD